MASRALRLHHRIVIPMMLVALVTTALAAFVSQSFMRRTLEARVVAQLSSAAAAISRSDFALNQQILGRVRDITGAEVLTYTTAGAVVASTLAEPARAELFAVVSADRSIESAPEENTVVRQTTCAAAPCFVAYRRVASAPNTIVALVEEASELNAATQAMGRTILLSAGIGLIVLVVVGQLVAARVTRPLDRLVAFTRDVSSGASAGRAPVGQDEIGTLAGAFNDMLDRLEKAQAAVVRSEKLALTGVLAARVAHDIRNPLSSLKMQAQLLRSRVAGAEGQSMLQAILHDVEQVESVVRGLLELAKPGDVTLAVTPLNDVVSQVLDHLKLQLTHRRVGLATSLSPQLPPIPLDTDRFKHALLNVIANANDAMPNGGTLSVATSLAGDGTHVVLEVCDDGIGVDPAMLDKVFDPFVSSKREGVGLGLVNTKSIVERHGGQVRLAPRNPRGTCVTIHLPVSPMTATAQPARG